MKLWLIVSLIYHFKCWIYNNDTMSKNLSETEFHSVIKFVSTQQLLKSLHLLRESGEVVLLVQWLDQLKWVFMLRVLSFSYVSCICTVQTCPLSSDNLSGFKVKSFLTKAANTPPPHTHTHTHTHSALTDETKWSKYCVTCHITGPVSMETVMGCWRRASR